MRSCGQSRPGMGLALGIAGQVSAPICDLRVSKPVRARDALVLRGEVRPSPSISSLFAAGAMVKRNARPPSPMSFVGVDPPDRVPGNRTGGREAGPGAPVPGSASLRDRAWARPGGGCELVGAAPSSRGG